MKFTGFKVVPAICIDFSDEGKRYYGIAEDQDAELLNRAFEKAESGLDGTMDVQGPFRPLINENISDWQLARGEA